MTDSIHPENFFSKEDIAYWKKAGQLTRKTMKVIDKDSYYMSEAELTEEQRESKAPIGTKGLYRMYRFECRVCPSFGKKMPYSEAIVSGYQHCIEFKHQPNPFNPPVIIRGGVFKKEELYK